jgi:predicted ATPase/DNA-binding CsgD family transcriptional regulator
VPLALNRLIGRDRDVSAIHAALDGHRLVTLVGTGGIGKTRLALEIAQALQASYADGARLVELAALADESLVPLAVANALGVRERPDLPLPETLAEALRASRMLLVLDNCEHLIDACAALAGHLLPRCPDLQILATSREALAIDGEVAWQVAPLATPPDDGAVPLDALAALPSVGLFVERAAAVRAGFALTRQNAAAVAEICRRLDGLPLALELAAARVLSLSPEQVAERLGDRFALLTSGRRTAPPRHRALRATLDWSYDLLTEPEQRLLQGLAVFAGGWTLSAAEQMLGGGQGTRGKGRDVRGAGRGEAGSPLAVLDGLDRLVAQSLLRVEHPEHAQDAPGRWAEPRYGLLETVRQYAWERLEEAGELAAARQRHAAWCAELVAQAEQRLLGPEQVPWLVRLDDEYDNLRAALGWCAVADPTLGLKIAAGLWQFWRIRLDLSEGRQWLDRFLAAAPAPSVVRIQALAGAGGLAHWQLDTAVAQARYEEAVELARALGEQALLGRTLRELGTVLAARSAPHATVRELFQQGLALSRAAGDRRSVANNLMHQSRLAVRQGDYRRAARLIDESVALISETGDRWQLSMMLEEAGAVALIVGEPDRADSLFEASIEAGRELAAAGFGAIHRPHNPGTVAFWRGDAETAIAWYEQLLAMTRANEHTAGIAENLLGLGRAVLLQGDVPRAATLLEESLEIATARGNRAWRARALYGLGLVAWRSGDAAQALARLRESLAIHRDRAERLEIVACLEALAAVVAETATGGTPAERAMGWLGAADALRSAIGAPRPPVEQPAYARAIEAAARWLDDARASAARGAGLPLDDVLADALSAPPIEPFAVRVTAPEPARAPAPAAPEAYPAGLTERQVEILRLIAGGQTNAQIAEALGLSAYTVKHHVTHILNKTGCENRAAAAAFALRHRLA